jgi:hypothetical protein
MMPLVCNRVGRIALVGAIVALVVLVLGAGPAYAAGGHGSMMSEASILGTLASPITSVFSAIGSAVLGAFSWTISLASKFILVTLGALVRMLIPRSWAREAVQVFQWIVAIPDYAGTVSSPGGGHVYGFAGVNDLRQLFQWLGIGLLPLTLVYATSRAMLGRGDHVAAPVARVVVLAGLLVSYPYWWEQAAAVTNQVTSIILSPAPVVAGIHKVMVYATEGVALGGWQLIDLGLMAALAIELLALIFAKVVIILLGALLFATGPLMIGLVPTESGDVIARAWISAVATLLMLPVAWAAVFAVGAVLVGDASTAGPLIGGSAQVGSLLGGVIVAVAGAATLWLCLKAAREVGGLLRLQLGGLLVLAGRARSHASPTPGTAAGHGTRVGSAASSIRSFQGKVRAAGTAALEAAGPRTVATARAAGGLGRRGLVMTGVAGAGSAAAAGAGLAGRSAVGAAVRSRVAATAAAGAAGSRTGRAGAAAARMARAGTAAWQQHDAASPPHASEGGVNQARRNSETARSGEHPSRPAAVAHGRGGDAPAVLAGRSDAAPTRPAGSGPGGRDAAPVHGTGAVGGEGRASSPERHSTSPPTSGGAAAPRAPAARGSERSDAQRPAAPAPDPRSRRSVPAPPRPQPRSTTDEQSNGRE